MAGVSDEGVRHEAAIRQGAYAVPFEIDVQPRESDAVTVIGVLRLTADWDQDA